MKQVLLMSAICTVIAFCSRTSMGGEDLAGANNQFCFDIYQQVQGQEGNLFFSPFSLESALGMTYVGARGATAEEMARCLHLRAAPDKMGGEFRRWLDTIHAVQKNKKVELSTANGIWVEKTYDLLPDFIFTIKKDFRAELRAVDFQSAANEIRVSINHWVETLTHDKIKNLIGEGVLNSMTRMVLVNAVYFKGKWASPFKADDTRDMEFKGGSSAVKSVRMMMQVAKFLYAENDQVQVIEMPYEGRGVSMVVVLPRDPTGLPALEAAISAERLEQWLGEGRQESVQIFLPKFRTESQFFLKEKLANLGMKAAFENADFSGMSGRPDLFISAVIHKAFIDVDEEGTEAAAATAVVMELKAMAPTQPKVFLADHPFLFVIRELSGKTILFAGRLSDPTK